MTPLQGAAHDIPSRWPKWYGHPSLAKPYPLVLDPDGKHVLKGNGFIGVAHQLPGEWFWTGFVLAHGELWNFSWPSLQVAAYDIHRHLRDSRALGHDWAPATWFDGHLPRCVRQSKGRPSIAGSWRLSLQGNVLTLQRAPGPGPHRHGPWQVFWYGGRVIAN